MNPAPILPITTVPQTIVVHRWWRATFIEVDENGFFHRRTFRGVGP